jgi:hypothetical protein
MENSTFDYYASAINFKLEENPAKIATVAKCVGKAWGHGRKCPLAIHDSKVVLVSEDNKEFFGVILEQKFIPASDKFQPWEFKSTQKTIQSIINEIVK